MEIDLAQVEVDRLGFAHAGAIEQGDHRRITQPLRARVGRAGVHQFTDQAALEVAPAGQACALGRLDAADAQQLILADQAQTPGLVHHPTHRIDVQRRGVGRITIGAQGRHQGGDMARFKLVPRHLADVAILETQAVGGILEDVLHGQLTGRRQAGEVLQQGVLQ
ncbi:hypothetical protein D3C81_1460340 [compost metagenome]